MKNRLPTLQAGAALVLLACATMAFSQGAAPAPAAVPAPSWTYAGSLSLRVTYDSNVYLQKDISDLLPGGGTRAGTVSRATPGIGRFTIAEPNEGSFIGTVGLNVTATYRDGDRMRLVLGYNPEFNWFASASSETHTIHRLTFNVGGRIDGRPFEFNNRMNYTDGSRLYPIYRFIGGQAAIGAVPVRSRREQIIYLTNGRMTFTAGDFIIRPMYAARFWDWMTENATAVGSTTALFPGYSALVDRRDGNVGVDVGYKINKDLTGFLGYRFGLQQQEMLLAFPERWGSTYQRVIFGLEGKISDNLRAAVSFGPDFRRFQADSILGADAGSDRTQTLLWSTSSLTFTPTKNDTVVVTFNQDLIPTQTGRGAFEDTHLILTYSRKIDDKLTVGGLASVNYGDFNRVVKRPTPAGEVYRFDQQSYIYALGVNGTYAFDKKLMFNFGYTFDWAHAEKFESAGSVNFGRVPLGREYNRHQIWVGMTQTF